LAGFLRLVKVNKGIMGKRGPAPLPLSVLKARGSHHLTKNMIANEVQDSVELPSCPDWLDDLGSKEWHRLAPLLIERGTASLVSSGVLAGLCHQWSIFVRYSKLLNEHKQEHDLTKLRRIASIAKEAYSLYLKSSAEFGLSPATKTRVVSSGGSVGAEDELSGLL
jgi:phage terminase small subunit